MIKRKPGRPKKNAAIEYSKPVGELSEYRIYYRVGDGTSAYKSINAQTFEIAPNGDLILMRNGAMVAAFRDWQCIETTGQKAAENGIASTSYPTVGLASQVESIPTIFNTPNIFTST